MDYVHSAMTFAKYEACGLHQTLLQQKGTWDMLLSWEPASLETAIAIGCCINDVGSALTDIPR